MTNATTAPTVKATRYITRKDCPCGAGRTSALMTDRYPAGSSNRPWQENAAAGAVFIGPTASCLNDVCIVCRGCGKPRGASAVQGRISLKHTCGAKCLASKGPSCECSCGGKNHGASYGAVA